MTAPDKTIASPVWFRVLLLAVAFNAAVYTFLRSSFLNPDGIEYFSYLMAIFQHHTYSFLDIYQHTGIAIPLVVTSQGWVSNMGAVGTAILWIPSLWAAKIYLAAIGVSSFAIWDPTFFRFVNFANMLYGAGSMVLLHAALKRLNPQASPVAVCLLTIFGTPLFFYSFIAGTTSHPASAFASTLCLWFWIRTIDDQGRVKSQFLRWFVLGMLGGLASSVRTQEVLVLLPACAEWLVRFRKQPENRPALVGAAAWIVTGFSIGFLPQMITWKILNGSFFKSSEAAGISTDHYDLFSCLVSSYHGLWIWTPIYFFAMVGFVRRALRRDAMAIALGMVLLSQTLLLGLATYWWEGFSFGMRLMTGSVLVVGVGLGYFIEDLRAAYGRFGIRAGLLVLTLCAMWTLSLALQGYVGNLELLLYVGPQTLIRAAMTGWQAIPTVIFHAGTESAPFWILIPIELAAAGWGYACVRAARVSLRRLSMVLSVSLAILVLYAAIHMTLSGQAPKPDLTGVVVLTEPQMKEFYQAEIFHDLGLYHARRGDLEKAQRWFDRSETVLPDTPATKSWRAAWSAQKIDRAGISP